MKPTFHLTSAAGRYARAVTRRTALAAGAALPFAAMGTAGAALPDLEPSASAVVPPGLPADADEAQRIAEAMGQVRGWADNRDEAFQKVDRMERDRAPRLDLDAANTRWAECADMVGHWVLTIAAMPARGPLASAAKAEALAEALTVQWTNWSDFDEDTRAVAEALLLAAVWPHGRRLYSAADYVKALRDAGARVELFADGATYGFDPSTAKLQRLGEARRLKKAAGITTAEVGEYLRKEAAGQAVAS